ncbi:MAG: cation diffusion facilitator family transporter [Gordonia sp. (in: high G+C Gram-positive bacteria)]
MGHSHSHGHSHSPVDAAGAERRRVWPMAVAAALIGGYFLVELTTGFLVDSLALIADAGHMLTDLVALGMGLAALVLARVGGTTDTRTFGWHRAEVFTAVANAVLLFGVAAFVLYEAIARFGTDPEIPGRPLIVVALIGLSVNVGVMLLLRTDSTSSIAVRGAYLEVLADAVGSVGVLLAGIIAATTGWGYADTVVAAALAVWVVPRAARLAVDALRILNQQAPPHIDVDAVRAELAAIDGVADVHDLHVWSLTTGMDVATVHLGAATPNAQVLPQARTVLAGYGLEHATVQVDTTDDCACRADITW